ncbi:MAG: bifunctional hydroxymethylpyrimidine kinase/phosphomethylpyrimidine kinase [Synechococcaceae cyanobacterium SM2_3_2]|nr:bifunctional hydroxymethylpyrimidine kinase/phosphomethylpyrimidine kinase [Synechococcaceae cyanobacterium SM2_3_2]
MPDLTPPIALTIAGSDSGGGAGIQADLKTFAFHQVHGTSAITCVTAQSTQGVMRVDALPWEAVTAQIDAILTDMTVQAAKTGMLLNAEIILAVAQQIQPHTSPAHNIPNWVVDPVMVSRTGSQLIDDDAIQALREEVIPYATILTPNRFEAQILSGMAIHSLEDMQQAAQVIYHQMISHRTIHSTILGSPLVLVKGGGMSGSLRGTDVAWDGEQFEILPQEAIPTQNTHGTGCTLSAAITAGLAQGKDPWEAIRQGKAYVTQALNFALAIGHGQGPVGHFFPLLGCVT